MAADPSKRLRVAIIYSYGANEAETDGILDEENPEDTSALDQNVLMEFRIRFVRENA